MVDTERYRQHHDSRRWYQWHRVGSRREATLPGGPWCCTARIARRIWDLGLPGRARALSAARLWTFWWKGRTRWGAVRLIGDELLSLQALLTRRFLFNAHLPTLIYVSLILTVIILFTGADVELISWWETVDIITRIVAVASYLAAVWLLAVAVAGQWRAIVRTYEGYPVVAVCRRLGRTTPGVLWHRAALGDVNVVNPDPSKAYYLYPHEDWERDILPTRLGNILLSAERYPLTRYGIDPIIFWPRLFPLLPERFQRDYEEFVREYEFPLVVSFLSILTGGALGVTALATGQSAVTFLLSFTLPITIAYVGYLVSLPSAVQMGEQQRTAFDLFRGRLLDAWPTVEDVVDERTAFSSIGSFVLNNAPPRWRDAQSRYLARRKSDSQADNNAAGEHAPR